MSFSINRKWKSIVSSIRNIVHRHWKLCSGYAICACSFLNENLILFCSSWYLQLYWNENQHWKQEYSVEFNVSRSSQSLHGTEWQTKAEVNDCFHIMTINQNYFWSGVDGFFLGMTVTRRPIIDDHVCKKKKLLSCPVEKTSLRSHRRFCC